ncbi:hypothetical protein BS47DRAFT_1367774 [Hydnum rufescens UP504]|uniref:Uncharacterized protein n=1 Tax=Hydnum rufescens UP504 TaxID=1448309 RepID=A0A9P6AIC8_9AGAM|nr:hypothetical protein BS47DRAFT_1367774 [Hydnum rufescens UP504]
MRSAAVNAYSIPARMLSVFIVEIRKPVKSVDDQSPSPQDDTLLRPASDRSEDDDTSWEAKFPTEVLSNIVEITLVPSAQAVSGGLTVEDDKEEGGIGSEWNGPSLQWSKPGLQTRISRRDGRKSGQAFFATRSNVRMSFSLRTSLSWLAGYILFGLGTQTRSRKSQKWYTFLLDVAEVA